jgi:uncharacterized protein (DUF4415 family)
MPDQETKVYSLEEIRRMRANGLVRETAPDAPEIEPDDDFRRNAQVVPTRGPRPVVIHLQLDPETVVFFQADGDNYLGRMADVLRAYARSHAAPAEHPAG